MRNFLLPLFIILNMTVNTVNAKEINKQEVPKKVFDYIYKHHPKAQGITVEEKNHFGRLLYKVLFKEVKKIKNDPNKTYTEEVADLFKLNGTFYTNEATIEKNAFDVILSKAIKTTLQQQYPEYEIMAMKMVVNPSGVGEEYEIKLLARGKISDISINDKGKIINL